MKSTFKNVIDKILSIPPMVWVGIYVPLQAFLYFQPNVSAVIGSCSLMVVDPDLFSRDIIRHTAVASTTYFFKLMHLLLGEKMLDLRYLFWPYLATCSFLAFVFYLFGKLISGGKKEVGLLMLVVFVVQKYLINGAYVSFIYSDYFYQHFTLPFLMLSIYLLLRQKYFFSMLVLVFSFYFHLKTSSAVALAFIPLLAYEVWKNPRRIFSIAAPFLLLIPKIVMTFNNLYVKSSFTAAEKFEWAQMALKRDGIEANVVFDEIGITNLIVYVLVAAAALWLTRLVADAELRKRIYYCHFGVFFAMAIGWILKTLEPIYGPFGEILILGYPRASIMGTILFVSTLTFFLYQKIEMSKELRNQRMLLLFTALLFFFALNDLYFASLSEFAKVIISKKTISKLIFAFGAAVASAGIMKILEFKLSMKKTVVLFLILTLSYVGVKGAWRVHQAYEMNYPFVPFQPVAKRFFNKDYYDVQTWIKQNTDKHVLLLVIESVDSFKKDEGDCNGGFRNGSARSVWCQDIVSVYGHAESFREWKRRRQLLQEYLGFPFEAWRPLIKAEGIDYIVSLKGSQWPKEYKLVYENPVWVVYKVNPKD